MRRHPLILLFTLLGILHAPSAWAAARDAIGGGWLKGGADAEYFANADLSGTPAFTRRDVRVDFDWGALRGPGGSRSPGFAGLGADNFSVRWTGQIMARFGETYQFAVQCDDGARLFIRPAGAATWTTLIDQWSTPGTHYAPSALIAGQPYDLRLEYRELTGTALCRLRWSSASTPEEVLEIGRAHV